MDASQRVDGFFTLDSEDVRDVVLCLCEVGCTCNLKPCQCAVVCVCCPGAQEDTLLHFGSFEAQQNSDGKGKEEEEQKGESEVASYGLVPMDVGGDEEGCDKSREQEKEVKKVEEEAEDRWAIQGVQMMVLECDGKTLEAPRLTIVNGSKKRDVYLASNVFKFTNTCNVDDIPFSKTKNSYLLQELKRPIMDTLNGRRITVWEKKRGRHETKGGRLAGFTSGWIGTETPIDEYRPQQQRKEEITRKRSTGDIPDLTRHPMFVVLVEIASLCRKKNAKIIELQTFRDMLQRAMGERFGAWLDALRPLEDKEWFYGHLNEKQSEQAEEIMEKNAVEIMFGAQGKGPFFVRLSLNEPGKLTLVVEGQLQIHFSDAKTLLVHLADHGITVGFPRSRCKGVFIYDREVERDGDQGKPKNTRQK
jgi:hypothetical protein